MVMPENVLEKAVNGLDCNSLLHFSVPFCEC